MTTEPTKNEVVKDMSTEDESDIYATIIKTKAWKDMVAGKPYFGMDPGLVEARRVSRVYQHVINHQSADNEDRIVEYTRRLLPRTIPDSTTITPPFYCDYGYNIIAGKNFYANFNCCILDPAEVTIGDDVLLGPNVQIYTAHHPLDPEERALGEESAKPIVIGNKVWICGSAIICGGVTIGDGVSQGERARGRVFSILPYLTPSPSLS